MTPRKEWALEGPLVSCIGTSAFGIHTNYHGKAEHEQLKTPYQVRQLAYLQYCLLHLAETFLASVATDLFNWIFQDVFCHCATLPSLWKFIV